MVLLLLLLLLYIKKKKTLVHSPTLPTAHRRRGNQMVSEKP
nr:MAG TPA: hypothetical protein [Caudoviricetes sp.]